MSAKLVVFFYEMNIEIQFFSHRAFFAFVDQFFEGKTFCFFFIKTSAQIKVFSLCA